MSIEHIVVPYDFSDRANDALRVAAGIAKRTGARIDVVHVYEQEGEYKADGQRQRLEVDARLEQLPGLPFLQGVELRKFMLRQLSLHRIFSNPHLASANLVVMGTNGARSGMAGSNTQRVVRLAPMPVLVVKDGMTEVAPQHVVIASNFSEADLMKFEALKPFLDIFAPKLHLLRVVTPRAFERTADCLMAMDVFIGHHGLERYTTTVYNELSVEEGILNFATTIDADLIAMATHGRSGFFRVVSGSVTEGIVNKRSFPVLSVKL